MIRSIIGTALIVGTTLSTYPAFAQSTSPTSPGTAVNTVKQAQTDPGQGDLSAPQAQQPPIDKMDLDYFKGYATDTSKIVSSPLHWAPKDWIKFGLVLGGTGSLFLIDKEVKDFAQRNHSSVASGFASVGNAIGDAPVIYPAVGAFYLYGQLADDSKARRTSLLALESLVISGAFTQGLKRLSGRPRPETGESSWTWHGPSSDNRNFSFNSGHTSNAFAVATVLANEYKDVPYVAPAAYSLAALTGLARIYSDKHWASDTFLGAAIGHYVSKALLNYHKEDKNGLSNRLSLAPQVGKEMTGLTVNYQF